MMVSIRASVEECPVIVRIGDVSLEGSLCVPTRAQAIILFAHGSGSSRLSPRNHYVANTLRSAGLGTLLFDLLTKEEEEEDEYNAELRFNIRLLADRLEGATDWIKGIAGAEDFKIGYFGASTGAAAALVAAAERPDKVDAVVSRGGRPDMAADFLPAVKAPTLLIVGGNDTQVIKMNEFALHRLNVKKQLEIIPNATHLFEEAGALEQAAELARDWFVKYLVKRRPVKSHQR